MAEKLSFSKLDTYSQCPYKYHLRYDLKNFISKDNVASMLGSLVHKIFEMQTNWLIAKKPIDYEFLKKFFVEADGSVDNLYGTNELAKMYKDDWYSVDKTGKSYAQKAQRFLEVGIYRLEKYMADNPDLELYAAELPFEYYYRGYLFHGFIDRVFMHKSNPAHLELHDIKTSAKAYDDKKCKTPLQMLVYVNALKEILPKQNFGRDYQIDCFYEFPVAEEMKAAGSPGWYNRGMKKLDSLINGIESGDYKANASPLCYWCEYSNSNPGVPEEGKNMCPYYSLWKPDSPTFNTFLPWLGMECDEIQKKKLLQLASLNDNDDFEI